MLNKRVANKATTQAANIKAIPSEIQAKKGHRAVDCGFDKVLTADIARQRRLPTALCSSNDTKQCYDQILHMVSNICLQRVGVHQATSRVMLGTLQQMQHYIKSACRTSERSYSCVQIPLQGVLQGNGAGPAIWALMSIPIINMLRTNLLTEENYYFACFTYVDDTDLVHTGKPNTAEQQLLREMQQC
jgi:hypothetical protein